MKKYRLPKEFAEKWLTALKSGEYKQGDGQLFKSITDGNEYCCLGVACAISGISNDDLIDSAYITYSNFQLDKIVQIPEELIGSSENELVWKVSSMNDKGKSFLEIARWIKRYVEFVP